jgi:hypothetical protein
MRKRDQKLMDKLDEPKQVVNYICNRCAAHCDDCRVDYCYRCQICICNINESQSPDSENNGGEEEGTMFD